ncbi:hypothetical protein [Gelria sp. Kuro-4]|uniref:hypothetical protein n=1 Tax=Gelria sp. Kuro-4 TaxID=2796927 RepID=UPI001C821EEE|nr:hypothetical protein [Gelria sp. Kuro-4]
MPAGTPDWLGRPGPEAPCITGRRQQPRDGTAVGGRRLERREGRACSWAHTAPFAAANEPGTAMLGWAAVLPADAFELKDI